MDQVRAQYEVYPYPERKPSDEKKRLVMGSPSMPAEIDHYLYAGKRDWREPMKVLFAGGGTGDGLIQFAAMMKAANRACEITYVDLSTASREIAEARAKIREIDTIKFETGSLLDAPEYGQFDYIDCCGVLHHLENPLDGFKALEHALAPEGGIGAMVYAPYGRVGVYALQETFNALYGDLPPDEKLKAAKKVYKNLPKQHAFKQNPHLVDHEQSDAGFYDLLLHSQDRAFDVIELCDVMDQAGLRLVSFLPPIRYDLSRFVESGGDELNDIEKMAVAEKLDGGLKTHIFYAARSGEVKRETVSKITPDLVPNLVGGSASQVTTQIMRSGSLSITMGAEKSKLDVSPKEAPAISLIDGKRSLAEIAQILKLDPIGFNAIWGRVDRGLRPWGLLLYSGHTK